MADSRILRTGRRASTGAALLLGTTAALALAGPTVTGHGVAGPVLLTDDARVTAGEALVVRGRGFPKNAHISLRAGRDGKGTSRIGSAETGRRGAFVARVRIDEDAHAGRYVAMACHDHCKVKATLHFHVQQP